MIHITSTEQMQADSAAWRKQGLTVALVPTMGYFHEGHLALMRQARQQADRVVVSLFVNPMQFGPKEDLAAYPRDLQRDSQLARQAGADVLFVPEAAAMYSAAFQTRILVDTLSQGLCGASRPGHFAGVATVVCKLFHLCNPHVAFFGEKDFQQLAIIRQMVADLNFPIEIIGHPIVREPDGLAMSSRNTYLSTEDRAKAPCLFQALQMAQQMARQTEIPLAAEEVELKIRQFIEKNDGFVVDYVSIVDWQTLQPNMYIESKSLVALAVRVRNRIRLIDNILFE